MKTYIKETYHLFPSFSKFDGMLAVMSLRNDGNMKVYHGGGTYSGTGSNWSEDITPSKDCVNQISNEELPDSETVDKKAVANRQKFLSGLSIEYGRSVSVKSIHGDNIEIVSGSEGGKFIDKTDGLISAGSPGLFLCITVADCIPVVIFEPKKKIMCLLHCGWKGLVKGIIQKAVSIIKDNFSGGKDAFPDSLYAGIGPGIGVCHFEVEEDILPFFNDYPDSVLTIGAGDMHKSHVKETGPGAEILKPAIAGVTGKDRYFIDLKQIAKKQLVKCQVSPANIEINPDCTYCKSGVFFSFRKDKKKPVEAMMVLAGWKS